MTVVWQHGAEGSTDEADIAPSVTTFGDAFTSINKVGTATVKYDSAQAFNGTRSARVTRVASTDTAYMQVVLGTALTRMQAKCFYRHDLTAGITSITDLMVFRGSDGFKGYVGINTTGKLGLYNASNTGVSGSASANSLVNGVWYRIEAAIQPGATGTNDGLLEYAYYLGNSTTPEGTFTSSAISTGTANIDQCRFGIPTAGAGSPLNNWFDDMALGNASGFIGVPTTITRGPRRMWDGSAWR